MSAAVWLITYIDSTAPFYGRDCPFPPSLPSLEYQAVAGGGERRGEENGVFCLLRRHQPSGRKAAIADWGPLHSACPSSPLLSSLLSLYSIPSHLLLSCK